MVNQIWHKYWAGAIYQTYPNSELSESFWWCGCGLLNPIEDLWMDHPVIQLFTYRYLKKPWTSWLAKQSSHAKVIAPLGLHDPKKVCFIKTNTLRIDGPTVLWSIYSPEIEHGNPLYIIYISPPWFVFPLLCWYIMFFPLLCSLPHFIRIKPHDVQSCASTNSRLPFRTYKCISTGAISWRSVSIIIGTKGCTPNITYHHHSNQPGWGEINQPAHCPLWGLPNCSQENYPGYVIHPILDSTRHPSNGLN